MAVSPDACITCSQSPSQSRPASPLDHHWVSRPAPCGAYLPEASICRPGGLLSFDQARSSLAPQPEGSPLLGPSRGTGQPAEPLDGAPVRNAQSCCPRVSPASLVDYRYYSPYVDTRRDRCRLDSGRHSPRLRLEKTCSSPLEAALSLPAGLGPTGARVTGVVAQPTNNETIPAPRKMQKPFIMLHSFHLIAIWRIIYVFTLWPLRPTCGPTTLPRSLSPLRANSRSSTTRLIFQGLLMALPNEAI